MKNTFGRFILALWKPLLLLGVFVTAAAFNKSILSGLGHDTVALYQTVMPYVIGIGLWLSAAYLVIHLIRFSIWDPLSRRMSVPRLLRDITSVLVYTVAITGIVGSVFGQSIGAFLTAGGAMGIVIGLALRNLIVDLFMGMAVNFERPFEIGQVIRLTNGPAGKVTEVNWRTTRLVDSSGDMVVVPNSRIGDAIITNFSRPESTSCMEVVFCLDAAVPPARTLRVLTAAALSQTGTARCLESPAPYAQVRAITSIGIEYGVVYYMDSNKTGPAWPRHLMLIAVLEQLHQAGIGIAVPKQDVFQAPMPQRQLDSRALEDRVALLGRVPLFESLTVPERQQLAVAMHEHLYKAGTKLISEGEAGESMFIPFEGMLEVFITAKPGEKPTRVGRLTAGMFFGEMSMLTGDPRSATVTAACDAIVFEIAREHMATIIQNRPEIALAITTAIAKRRASQDSARNAGPGVKAEEHHSFVQQTVKRILAFFGVSNSRAA